VREFTFVVFDVPTPLGRPRFARTKVGVRTYTPRKDQEARFNIRKAWLELGQPDLVTGALRMEVTAWLPMPKSIPKKRRQQALPTVRPDLDNYVKQVSDALQGYAFEDDKTIVTSLNRKRYVGGWGDPEGLKKPSWEISIFVLEGGQ
jgi:Holliday junction resolvase RusA-like endonuclease